MGAVAGEPIGIPIATDAVARQAGPTAANNSSNVTPNTPMRRIAIENSTRHLSIDSSDSTGPRATIGALPRVIHYQQCAE